MNITRWEPFREMEDMLRQFSPVFARQWPRESEATDRPWRPVANISENEKEYIIKAELPEVDKDDIEVTLTEGVLTIRGERKYKKEDQSENDLRIESYYGSFSRSFSLPENADAERISADCKDGVLRVRIPKTQQKESKPVSIRVQ